MPMKVMAKPAFLQKEISHDSTNVKYNCVCLLHGFVVYSILIGQLRHSTVCDLWRAGRCYE